MDEDFVMKQSLQLELKRQDFYKELTERFNLGEIKQLCFVLDIKYEGLKGETLHEKAIALFEYCERSQRLHDLFQACQQVRSETNWYGFLRPVSPKFPGRLAIGQETKRNWWLVSGVLIAAFALGVVLGWFVGNGRDVDTNAGDELVTLNKTSIPTLANVKERFEFEADTSEEPMAGWGLKTCLGLDTTQCGWLNADDKLSLAETGFSGENSLQVEATLVNAEQIYTTERCFDPTILDEISANIYVPTREEGNGQSLAATKIYLLARPQGDINSTQQWPTSVLELDKATQPGWYQISLDLSQVADERRDSYDNLLVDCVHIDFILPVTTQNESTRFLIDDVALYRSNSSHALITNIPPKGLIADLTNVTTPLGDGLVYNFEDGVIDNTFWTAGEDPLYVSRDHAYNGIYSMAIDAHLEEHEGFSGTENACLTMHSTQNAQGYSLRNQIVIIRIYVPDDAPDNLQVQFHLMDSGFWPTYGSISAGQWNTFVWYTADAPEMEKDSSLDMCLILRDREFEDGSKNSYNGTFYIDSVELIPYQYTYSRETAVDTYKALIPVSYYAFDVEALPSSLTVLSRQTENVNPMALFDNEDIAALRLDLNLPSAKDAVPTIDNSAGIILSTNDEPVEAVLTFVFVPEDPGGSLSITFEGSTSNGQVISQTFPLVSGHWTPVFWPTRENDFDASSDTQGLEKVTIYITSSEVYQGPIFFDYLATYRFFPEEQE